MNSYWHLVYLCGNSYAHIVLLTLYYIGVFAFVSAMIRIYFDDGTGNATSGIQWMWKLIGFCGMKSCENIIYIYSNSNIFWE